jgi:NAD(P)-dependent dehydrogenase (short-subunit alcohol dehydrogenase family)
MEGVSDIMITYLPAEKKDADKAKEKIEKFGAKCHIYEVDLTEQGACKKLADAAVETMGSVNILFNNAAFQEVLQARSLIFYA